MDIEDAVRRRESWSGYERVNGGQENARQAAKWTGFSDGKATRRRRT